MKTAYILLFCLSLIFSVKAQPPVARSSSAVTAIDARVQNSMNFTIPRYRDTADANTNLGIDSVGSMIYTRDSGFVWARVCCPKKWEKIKGLGGVIVSSYGKNAARDSTILILSDGTRYAAKDSIGSGGGLAGIDSVRQVNTTDTVNQYTAGTGTKAFLTQRVFNVKDYGAKGDSVTNDTRAFQLAINAADSAGNGAVVYVPNPKVYYKIGDTLVAASNSQLYIPYHNGLDKKRNHITIRGESLGNGTPVGSGLSYATPITARSGTTIKSTLTVGANGAAIIGTAKTSGVFNITALTVENLNFEVLHNPTGSGPVIGGISYKNGANLFVNRVNVYVDTSGYNSTAPTLEVSGIETPDDGSSEDYGITQTKVIGMKNGYKIGEHVTLNQTVAESCLRGYNIKDGSHSLTGLRAAAFWCGYDIYVSGSFFRIQKFNLDAEWQQAGRWFDDINTIYDPSNSIIGGDITYTIIESNFGLNNSKFSKNGGSLVVAQPHDNRTLVNGSNDFRTYSPESTLTLGNTTTHSTAWTNQSAVIEMGLNSIFSGQVGDFWHSSNARFESGWKYKSTGVASNIGLFNGQVLLRTVGSGAANSNLTWNEVLTVDNAGVKIGASGTPTEKLQVEGNIRFAGALMPNNTAGTTGQTLTSAGPGASPTWTTPFSLPSLTSGSVLFSNGSTIAQDNSNFFWDNTNKRLGIGTATPMGGLHLKGPGYINAYIETTTAAGANFIFMGPTEQYAMGVRPDLGAGTFAIVDNGAGGIQRLGINSSGFIKIGTGPGAAELDVTGNAIISGNLSAANIITRLATVGGIDAKTVSATNLYTAPADYVITEVRVRSTISTSITSGPTADVYFSAPGDVFASNAISALTTTAKIFNFPNSGMSTILSSGSTLKFNITTASTGTSQTLSVDVFGYKKP